MHVLDPAVLALLQLLASERDEAQIRAPELVQRADPYRLWLLWFAIGATVEVCSVVRRRREDERNAIFREVIHLIFEAGGGSGRSLRVVPPEAADRGLVGLFESAGVEAVRSCLRGEARLGYYLEALWSISGH